MPFLTSLLLWCFGCGLGTLSGSQARDLDLNLATDQQEVEINVGLNATLVWRYSVKDGFALPYEILWGTSDDGSNLKEILFTQDKNGKPQITSIPPEYVGRVQIVDQASLVITNTKLTDEGWYTCELRSLFLTVKKSIKLRVIDPPQITKKPQGDVYPKEYDQLMVTCKARGFPAPKITWIKLEDNKQVGQGDTLLFSSVQRTDNGLYSCVASNEVGKPAAAYVRINVKYAPKINKTVTKTRVAAFQDQAVVLHCVADGQPVPRYQWTTPSGIRLPIREGNGTVTVRLDSDDKFGHYVCLVQNQYGTDTIAVVVEKVVKPAPVSMFRTPSATAYSVSLRWSPPNDVGNSKITKYVLKYSEDEKTWTTKVIEPEVTSLTVKGLLAYTEYTFELKVANEFFTSDAITLMERTTEAAPGAPRKFVAQVINSSAVSLSWLKPKRPNGIITSYKITFGIVGQYPSHATCPHNVTSYVLGGLRPFTNYSIEIIAQNGIGGAKRSVIQITTEQHAPGKPRDLTLNYTGRQVIQLMWRRPRVLNGIVVGLRVRLQWWRNDTSQSYTDIVEETAISRKSSRARRATSRDGHKIIVEKVEPFRSVVIKNLMFYSLYRISVSEGTGSERVLWGPYTNVTRPILTPEGASSMPLNLKITRAALTSLSISWKRPLFPNGRIRTYIVQYWNSSDVYSENISRNLNNQTFFIVLKNLKPLATYKVRVQAYTLHPGELSEVIEAKTEVASTGARTSDNEIDSASLLGGVCTGIVLLGFLVIGIVVVYRNRRKKRDSAELQKGRYAVANSNDSGIGEKESMDGGLKYTPTTPRRGSEGSESWV